MKREAACGTTRRENIMLKYETGNALYDAYRKADEALNLASARLDRARYGVVQPAEASARGKEKKELNNANQVIARSLVAIEMARRVLSEMDDIVGDLGDFK